MLIFARGGVGYGWVGERGEGLMEVRVGEAFQGNNSVPPAGLGSGMALGVGHEGGGLGDAGIPPRQRPGASGRVRRRDGILAGSPLPGQAAWC